MDVSDYQERLDKLLENIPSTKNMQELILNNKAYHLLSNYSNHSIGYGLDGNNWKSVCHYYQAQKFVANMPGVEIVSSIFNAESPKKAEEMGIMRHGKPKDFIIKTLIGVQYVRIEPKWNNMRYAIMKKALYAKMIQYLEVRECLFSTEGATLIFHSNNQFWGINEHGEGQNQFGNLLMELRAEFLKDGTYDELEHLHMPMWVKYPQSEPHSSLWRQGNSEYYYHQFWYWYNGLSEVAKKAYQLRFPPPKGWKASIQ